MGVDLDKIWDLFLSIGMCWVWTYDDWNRQLLSCSLDLNNRM